MVSAAMKSGVIGEVEISSQAGAECVLRNPFSSDVALYRDGKKAETLSGSLLKFATRRGELIRVGPALSPAR